MIFLEIDSAEGLIAFVKEAKKTGLLRDISMDELENITKKKRFPVRIPVNMNAVLDLCRNPILKRLFGAKIDSKAKRYLEAIKAGP